MHIIANRARAHARSLRTSDDQDEDDQNRKQKQQLEAYQQQLQAAEDYTRQNALATGIGNTLTSIFKIFK